VVKVLAVALERHSYPIIGVGVISSGADVDLKKTFRLLRVIGTIIYFWLDLSGVRID